MGSKRNLAWLAARASVGTAFRGAFRVRFAGLQHIPREGGALLAYNHVSVLDPIPVAMAAARRGREARFLALSELFESGLVGWGLRTTGQIPLRRGLGDWDAIEAIAAVLREGNLAGMSPEGTVGPGDELLPGQRGAARIALAAAVPTIPVAVWGTQARWPQAGLHWRRPMRPSVAVVAGPPIPPEGSARSRPDTIAHTERLMAALGDAVRRARAMVGNTAAVAPKG